MAKFKIVKEFVLNGVLQKLDSVVEFDFKTANLRSIQENIQKVDDNGNPIKETKITPPVKSPKVEVPPVPSAPKEPLPPTKMAEYKVVETFELDGVAQEVDAVVELTDEQAVEFAGKVELVEGEE